VLVAYFQLEGALFNEGILLEIVCFGEQLRQG